MPPSSFTNWSLDGSVRHTVQQVVSEPGHRFESLEPHCEGGIVKDFTIRSNTNGLGLRSNAIKDLCPLIVHQLVVGWIGKAHCSTITMNQNSCIYKAYHKLAWGGNSYAEWYTIHFILLILLFWILSFPCFFFGSLHLEVPFPYILLSSLHLNPLSPPT